jgi:hypothetical protein
MDVMLFVAISVSPNISSRRADVWGLPMGLPVLCAKTVESMIVVIPHRFSRLQLIFSSRCKAEILWPVGLR